MLIPKEDQEAMLVHEYLQRKGIWHTHIANERGTSIQQGVKLKRMGISPGFPDFIALVPTRTQGTCTVFIELKRRKKPLKRGGFTTSHTKVSPEQLEWIHELNKCEFTEARVCYGAEEVINYIEELNQI